MIKAADVPEFNRLRMENWRVELNEIPATITVAIAMGQGEEHGKAVVLYSPHIDLETGIIPLLEHAVQQLRAHAVSGEDLRT